MLESDVTITIETDAVPLRVDAGGTVRVSGTRVTLDTIIGFYNQGMSAEELTHAFPSVPLADAHAVIAFYLRRRAKIDDYLSKRNEEAEQKRREFESKFPPKGPTREELLDRWRQKHGAPVPR